MRVITVNLNGIRAAARKDFFSWLPDQDADFICIQETKAQQHQLTDEIFHPTEYFNTFVDAQKKGYSGVALYAKQKPKKVTTQLGWEVADSEGRFVQFDYDNLSIISLYMPSGTSGDERQALKYEFMDKFMPKLKQFKRSKREFIVCGDFNIAHKQIDIKNWRGNQKNSGFLPEERAWMDKLFDSEGFVDAFRLINQEPDQYTWWSNRGQAYAKNVGWRIDYQVVTPGLKDNVTAVSVYKEQRFSDHAPLIVDYDYSL